MNNGLKVQTTTFDKTNQQKQNNNRKKETWHFRKQMNKTENLILQEINNYLSYLWLIIDDIPLSWRKVKKSTTHRVFCFVNLFLTLFLVSLNHLPKNLPNNMCFLKRCYGLHATATIHVMYRHFWVVGHNYKLRKQSCWIITYTGIVVSFKGDLNCNLCRISQCGFLWDLLHIELLTYCYNNST